MKMRPSGANSNRVGLLRPLATVVSTNPAGSVVGTSRRSSESSAGRNARRADARARGWRDGIRNIEALSAAEGPVAAVRRHAREDWTIMLHDLHACKRGARPSRFVRSSVLFVGWVSGSETHQNAEALVVGFASAHPPYKDRS